MHELSVLPLVQCSALWKYYAVGRYVSCGSMNDVAHKLFLFPVLFSHFSDNCALTKADVHCKVLYMNFVESLGAGYSRV